MQQNASAAGGEFPRAGAPEIWLWVLLGQTDKCLAKYFNTYQRYRGKDITNERRDARTDD